LRPGDHKLEQILDKRQKLYCIAKLNHLKALLEFMSAKKGVYASTKKSLAQGIAELEAFLRSH